MGIIGQQLVTDVQDMENKYKTIQRAKFNYRSPNN